MTDRLRRVSDGVVVHRDVLPKGDVDGVSVASLWTRSDVFDWNRNE